MKRVFSALCLSCLLALGLCACQRAAPAGSEAEPTAAVRPTAPATHSPVPSPSPRPRTPTESRPYSDDMLAPLPTPKRYIPATPTPSPPPTPVPLNPHGQEIADYARQFLGYEYKYGGKEPETGFDCSGLVYYVYGQFGIPLNRTAADMAKNGEHVPPDELQPGDILLFDRGGWIGHAGIYVGDGQYIHSMDVGIGVVLSPCDEITAKLEIRRVFAS